MARKPNLENIQLILLTAAAMRADGNLLPAPAKVAKNDLHVRETIAILIARDLAEEISVEDPKLSWRIDDEKMFGAVISAHGRETVKISDPAPHTPETVSVPSSPPRPRGRPRKPPIEPATTPVPAAGAKAGSTIAKVIDLLNRKQGASMAEIMAATGWLAHSARAALSGLRKKQHNITCTKSDGGSVYRIVSTAK